MPTDFKDTLAGIAKDVKDASAKFLSEAADAVKTIAPAIWRTIKLKVISDAVALAIVSLAVLAIVWWFWRDNKYVMPITVAAVAFPFAGAVKRIIASDFFTLLEILGLAKIRGGNNG